MTTHTPGDIYAQTLELARWDKDLLIAERDRLKVINEGLVRALERIANRALLDYGDNPARECGHILAEARAALAKAKP